MKIIKGLAFFSAIAIVFGSCFDPPVYPNTPEIEFDDIEYVDAQRDSLFLYINFKDGDGDLGLDPSDPKYRSFPFNDAFYYQENNGQLRQLFSIVEPESEKDVIIIDDPTSGDLVFPRTRKKAAYSGVVPPFTHPYFCTDFVRRSILIELADSAALDKIAKTQSITQVKYSNIDFLELTDTLYFQPNPDHYNIEVDFFVKNGNDYVEYDWRKDGCDRITYTGQSFDARFPMFTDKEGSTLEGNLKYGMYSLGFKEIFGNKTLRLEITIKDRARNKSNKIVTKDFTLLEILKKK